MKREFLTRSFKSLLPVIICTLLWFILPYNYITVTINSLINLVILIIYLCDFLNIYDIKDWYPIFIQTRDNTKVKTPMGIYYIYEHKGYYFARPRGGVLFRKSKQLCSDVDNLQESMDTYIKNEYQRYLDFKEVTNGLDNVW
jgi:hypothetical protein